MLVEIISTIITAIIWFTAGMIFMSVISINRNKELKEEKDNAELRAVTHFRKLQDIENIIRKDMYSKIPAFFTLREIKKVLVDDRKSEN